MGRGQPQKVLSPFFSLLSGTIVLAAALSGCVVDEGRFLVGWPRVGDQYVYIGDDGSSLTVRFVESRERAGEKGVQYLFRPMFREHGDIGVFDFEEVLKNDLSIHEQRAYCGQLIHREGSSPECVDGSTLVVRGSEGLPSALSMSGLWGERIDITPLPPVVIGSPLFPGLELRYGVERIDEHCLEIRDDLSTDQVEHSRILYFTYPTERVLCRGEALPRSFVTLASPSFGRVHYTLTNFETGGEDRFEKTLVHERGRPLPAVRHGCPLYVNEVADPYPFSAKEAHQAAIKENEQYRALFEDPCGGIVFRSGYSPGPSTQHPLFQTEIVAHERLVEVVDNTGAAWGFTVWKNSTSVHGISNVSYYVSGPVDLGDRSAWMRSFEANSDQVPLEPVYRLATALTGYQTPAGYSGFTHAARPHLWSAQPPEVLLESGYEISLGWRPLHMEGRSGGFMVHFSVFDGPTGAPIFYHRA